MYKRQDSYILNGRKTWITNARHADPLPVLAKTDPGAVPVHAGMSVLLVDAGTPGFEVVRDLPKLGYHGPETCELVLDDARVPASALLGDVYKRQPPSQPGLNLPDPPGAPDGQPPPPHPAQDCACLLYTSRCV